MIAEVTEVKVVEINITRKYDKNTSQNYIILPCFLPCHVLAKSKILHL